ncbi:MAG TPA: hypothetical protein VFE47_30225 [Tepidisphaeraceae bacterium]|jgi:hypothetical protein|nr:hypothetical protein [Tepidisphaeraceae bacterium]
MVHNTSTRFFTKIFRYVCVISAASLIGCIPDERTSIPSGLRQKVKVGMTVSDARGVLHISDSTPSTSVGSIGSSFTSLESPDYPGIVFVLGFSYGGADHLIIRSVNFRKTNETGT